MLRFRCNERVLEALQQGCGEITGARGDGSPPYSLFPVKPLTSVIICFSVLVAMALATVLVYASQNIATLPHGTLGIAWMSIPVFLILACSYGLHLGSRLAGIVLGLIFSIMSATFLGYAVLTVVVLAKPISYVLEQVVWGTPLAVAAVMLLFPRILRSELQQLRSKSRAGQSRDR